MLRLIVQVKSALRASLEQSVLLVQLVQQGLVELLDSRESTVLWDRQASRVSLASQDRRASREARVFQVLLAALEREVPLETEDSLDSEETTAPLVPVAHWDLQDAKVLRATVDLQERWDSGAEMDSPDFQVIQVRLDWPEHQELRALLDSRVLLVTVETLERTANLEIQVYCHLASVAIHHPAS